METFLIFIAESSVRAGLLVIPVFLVNKFLLGRAPAKWRHLLWGIVALRLAVPAVLPEETALFRFSFEGAGAKTGISAPARITPENDVTPMPDASDTTLPESAGSPVPDSTEPEDAGESTILRVVFVAWLSGALGMLAMLTWNSWRHAARLRRASPVTSPDVLGLLDSCAREMRTGSRLRLLECPGVRGPALAGIMRPRLILPQGMAHEISRVELRHVFLHELAHFRRRDVPVNCACALLLAAHWFNPLLHFAFSRMRRDQEIACDEAVLTVLGESRGRDYGHTLINMAGYIFTPAPMIGAVGLGNDKQHLKERIIMINRWRMHGAKRLTGALALTLGLAGALFTEAYAKEPAKGAGKAGAPVTTKTGAKVIFLRDTPEADEDALEYRANEEGKPYKKKSRPGFSFFQEFLLPEGRIIISQPEYEAYSLGSYSVNLYYNDPADKRHETYDMINGFFRPRDGYIAKAWLADVDGDGKQDVVIRVRCIGTGGYMTLEAYGITRGKLRFLGCTDGLNPDDKGGPVRSTKASRIDV